MAKPTTVCAEQIMELLAAKHAKDVFVPECKNGSSWVGGVRRLDAWVLRKTWSPWTTLGYEVKVSRSDFESDQKWHEYLPLCHQFSFVCPSGLIKGHDLPSGVGLIWCSPRAQRLHTKIKAARRVPDTDHLAQLMSYVLMSRTRIVAGMDEANKKGDLGPRDRLAEYRKSVADAEAHQDLALFVRGHIRARIHAAERAENTARTTMALAERFAAKIASLGISWNVADGSWQQVNAVEREIDRLDHGLGEFTRTRLRRAATVLVSVLEQLESDYAPPPR